MADESKAEESMADASPKNPRVTNKIPWRMAHGDHGIHSLRNIEISGKKTGVTFMAEKY